MSTEPAVTAQVDPDGVGLVRLNRPQVHNAIDHAMQNELAEILRDLDRRDDCGCVIITGAGTRAFCAGFDIDEMTALDQDQARVLSRSRDDWNAELLQLGVPMIAAINGLAYGAGSLLALACDVRLGTPATVFGFTAGAYGGVMYTSTLPLIVGHGKASEYLLMSTQVSSEEALSSGLLNRVVPAEQLLDESRRIAIRIASNPSQSMRATKRLLRTSVGRQFDERFALEIQAKRELIDDVPTQRVFSGFTERRKSTQEGPE
ncbi:enoyl-CoA hydratase [Rhodococcus olei]|uniref:Enoyl-CoA hydratase n=1 Tax=Rhodococcus olei TaxID=2161675 RepID=A0ABP8NYT3_9NOCA